MFHKSKLIIVGAASILATSQNAIGAEFVYDNALPRSPVGIAQLTDTSSGMVALDSFIGSASSISVSLDTPTFSGTAGVYATPTEFGGWADVTGSNGGFQVSLFAEPVQVSETTQVLFEWDSANTSTSWVGGTYVGGGFLAEITSNGDYIDLINTSPQTAGSAIFTLEAGHSYSMLAPRFTVTLDEPGAYADIFYRISIVPSPSVLVCFSLAGAPVMVRRRR